MLHQPALPGLVSSRCWNHLDASAEMEPGEVAEAQETLVQSDPAEH